MALSPYCTNDEVRAVLGVTKSELADGVLDLPIYEIELRREIIKVASALPSDFLTVSGVPAQSRTEAEQALFDYMSMFSLFCVARRVGQSLEMFSPKTLTDDKASFTRFSEAGTPVVMDRIEVSYQAARVNLVDAYTVYKGSSATVSTIATSFVASKRTYDPVTG